MGDFLLVLNAGSSSLKYALFGGVRNGPLSSELRGQAESLDKLFSEELSGRSFSAVGHRVVHGGARFSAPVEITPAVLSEIRALTPLAPLHQPKSIEPIEAVADRFPDVRQFACFDTAFHSSQPELAGLVALPPEITKGEIKRYGFHGLSYAYIASVLAEYDPRAATGKTIVLHLGNGASMCALDGGRSIATTMGFSALDGLVMSTRCGSLDPGVVLYLLEEMKMEPKDVEQLLYKRSGLFGISGISGDMRELLPSESPAARLAVDLFTYRVCRELGSLVAALGGLDAIVFTAGIGEHSAEIRERVCRDARWIGVELDARANESGEHRISAVSSKVSAWIIPTDEELMIARHIAEIR